MFEQRLLICENAHFLAIPSAPRAVTPAKSLDGERSEPPAVVGDVVLMT